MPGQDVVSIPQPTDLSKHGKNPEVELCLDGKTPSQKEDGRCRCSLVKSEQSLKVYFVMLGNQVLFLIGHHSRGKPREENRNGKHCLHPDGGSRICPVPFGQASMEHSKHCFSVS